MNVLNRQIPAAQFVAGLLAAMTISCGNPVHPATTTPDSFGCEGIALVVTELLVNPVGNDQDTEYIEVMNISDVPAGFDGLTIVSGTEARPRISTLSTTGGGLVPPGGRFVVRTSDDNDTEYAAVAGSMNLPNTAGSVTLMCQDAEIVTVSWGTGGIAPKEGVALQLAPMPGPGHPEIWCESRDEPDLDGNRGSPGRPNHDCADAGRCVDAETGIERPLVRPVDGDIVVTEVFANPQGADRLESEWIEIMSLATFDLACLTVSHHNGKDTDSPSRTFKLPCDMCNRVGVGDIVVVGGDGKIALDGDSTLYNATGGFATIVITEPSGNVVATAVHPKVPDGKSVALDPEKAAMRQSAAHHDDDPASWIITSCSDKVAATPGFISSRCGDIVR